MFRKKTMEELDRLEAGRLPEDPRFPIILILDDIRSMHNVGSIFRSSDSFAVTALYLCGYTPAPPHRDIQKTALGATETVHWEQFAAVTEAIAKAKQNGYQVMAVEQTEDSRQLHEMEWDGQAPLALVLGNEVTGVSEAALELVSGVIEIPQFGSKHSLNVSVSAGVVLWELIRGRA